MRSTGLFFLALLHPFSLFAMQAGAYGELSGVVRDPQALRVPEALVTLTGSAVVGQLTAKTEGHGSYRFRALSPGIYSLGVTKAGFRPAERKGIALRTGNSLVIDNSSPVTSFVPFTGRRFGEVLGALDPRAFKIGVRWQF